MAVDLHRLISRNYTDVSQTLGSERVYLLPAHSSKTMIFVLHDGDFLVLHSIPLLVYNTIQDDPSIHQ